MRRRNDLKPAFERLREHALRYPGAREDFPWGESAIKVREKVFVFLHWADERLSVTVKLPWSSGHVTALPFAQPSGYGLGKSGWITSQFAAAEKVPLDLLCEWIDESYRAVAPRKLVAELDGPPGSRPAGKAPARRRKRSS